MSCSHEVLARAVATPPRAGLSWQHARTHVSRILTQPRRDLCSFNYYTWKYFHIYWLWVEFDLGAVNLNWPATLLSLQPPGKDNKPPASGAGCLWELLGGCLWGEADPHQSRSATRSLAPLQRGLEGKSCQPLASSAWLAFGKRITCPQEGEGPIAQSPSPSTNTDQPGLSSSSTSLSPVSWGQVPTNLSARKEKSSHHAFPHSGE